MCANIRFLILFVFILSNFGLLGRNKGNNQTHRAIINKYLWQHNNFETPKDVWGDYTIDLNVEAIINAAIQTNDSTFLPVIDRYFRLKNYQFSQTISFDKLPFCDVYFRYFQLKNDSSFVTPYIEESYRVLQTIPRTPEGAVCIRHKGENNMLIDFLQNYMIRMARAGWLTGDTAFYNEISTQLKIYSEILQYPDSKLFSQGRGWLTDKQLISPSAWLRGQAWLMRGLVTSLQYVPKNSKYGEFLIENLNIFANALLLKQDKSGMWHNLPLLSHNASYPEVSGSAMIAYYMLSAYDKGYLSDKKFCKAALKSKKAIRKYINTDFSIRSISPGPGTLYAVDEYKTNAEADNPHGTQAVILLLSRQ